jgi:hypothetical protein
MANRKPKADRTWGELNADAKRYYTNQGITAAPYNKFFALSQIDRTEMTKRAKAAGYDSGLKFTAVQAQVRQQTGQKITMSMKPSEAARRIQKGAKRSTPEGRYRYRQVTRLFDMEGWDHLQWTNFLSE